MLPADLIRVDGLSGLVRLAPGFEVTARVPAGAPGAGQITVVVRPEHATLTADATAPGLPATLDNSVFVGSDTQYYLRLETGAPFVVRSQNLSADAAEFRPGDRLRVRLGESSVQVLRD